MLSSEGMSTYMAKNKSKIEWTDKTWNPLTGCTKISSGCKHCYAETMSLRLKAMGSKKYINGFNLTLHPSSLTEPYRWQKPSIIFVDSMSDLFHKDVPLDYIKEVFKVMNENPQHVFQVLTKRADIMERYSSELTWSKNIWAGVSVEDNNALWRINHLSKIPSSIRFLSMEPLIEAIPNVPLTYIDWVIVGGESGQNPRPLIEEWVTSIRDQCLSKNVLFFFKQWGGRNKKEAGKLLQGKIYNAMPSIE